ISHALCASRRSTSRYSRTARRSRAATQAAASRPRAKIVQIGSRGAKRVPGGEISRTSGSESQDRVSPSALVRRAYTIALPIASGARRRAAARSNAGSAWRQARACTSNSEIPYARSTSSIAPVRSEEHTSELQSLAYLVCRLLLEKKKKKKYTTYALD